MKLDDIVKNKPEFPFEVEICWNGSEGKAVKRLQHELFLVSGEKRIKLMISSPLKCTGEFFQLST